MARKKQSQAETPANQPAVSQPATTKGRGRPKLSEDEKKAKKKEISGLLKAYGRTPEGKEARKKLDAVLKDISDKAKSDRSAASGKKAKKAVTKRANTEKKRVYQAYRKEAISFMTGKGQQNSSKGSGSNSVKKVSSTPASSRGNTVVKTTNMISNKNTTAEINKLEKEIKKLSKSHSSADKSKLRKLTLQLKKLKGEPATPKKSTSSSSSPAPAQTSAPAQQPKAESSESATNKKRTRGMLNMKSLSRKRGNKANQAQTPAPAPEPVPAPAQTPPKPASTPTTSNRNKDRNARSNRTIGSRPGKGQSLWNTGRRH